MTAIAIRVTNLSKRYRIGLQKNQGSPPTLMNALLHTLKRPIQNFRYLRGLSTFGDQDEQQGDIIWALRDISLEVPSGQTLGIVGNNGSGKSTLLKIMSNITYPTMGQVELYGRVSSLIGVGAGFNPELTGYENIYMNGIMLGMNRAQIDQKFDNIVAFSQIDQFLYTPLKRYSQGMRARLAFAVAAHLEPEILILDEALAAGDMGFRERCKQKMQQIAATGRTVVLVSHILPFVADLADRCLWMADGQIVEDGDPNDIIPRYLASSKQQGGSIHSMVAHEDSQIDVLYQQAQKNTDVDAALSDFSRVIELDPQHSDARLKRAQLYRTTQQWDLAHADLHELFVLQPDSVDALYERATIYRLQEKPEAALMDYMQILDVQPDHIDALYYGSFLLRTGERYDEAKPLLMRLCSLQPDHIAGWFEYGVCQRQTGQWDDAIRHFSRVIDLNPNHVGAAYERGQIYRHQEAWEAALTDFQHVVELCPGHIGAHYHCGVIYLKQDAIHEAIAAFTHTIRLDPEHAAAHYLRGTLYQQREAWSLALNDFSTVVALQPDHLKAYQQRATMYQRLGQTDAAIADYTHLIAQANTPADRGLYLLRRGTLYRMERQFAAAIDDLSRALELQPDHVAALYERGIVYTQTEEWAKAQADFSQAIEHQPTYSAAYLQRGLVWYQQSQHMTALQRLSETIDVVPASAYPQPMINDSTRTTDTSYYLQQAWDDFSHAISYEPDMAVAYYQRGVLSIKRDDLQAAMADMTAAVELMPDHLMARYERARIAQRQSQWDQALEDLAVMIDLRPNYATAYLVRAQIYHELQAPDKVIADLLRAASYNIAYLEEVQNWYVRH